MTENKSLFFTSLLLDKQQGLSDVSQTNATGQNDVTQTVAVVVEQKGIHNHHSGGGNPFLTIDPGMYLWTVITFLILLIILAKFAWRPILKVLDDREKFISKALKDAEQAKKEMEEITKKKEQLIIQANDQAKEIVSKGKESADRIAKDIEDRAKTETQKLLLSARKEIENEKNRAMSLLRIETADLVIRAASKLIDDNLDDEKNRKLIDTTIQDLSEER